MGSHSEDANHEVWWLLQDDAASTTVSDETSNSRDGTLNGGNNTSDISTTGPNSWLPKGLSLDGSADFIRYDSALVSAWPVTVLYFASVDSTESQGVVWWMGNSAAVNNMFLGRQLTSGSEQRASLMHYVGAIADTETGSQRVDGQGWQARCDRFESDDLRTAEVDDVVSVNWSETGKTFPTTNRFTLGRADDSTPSGYTKSILAGAAVFSRTVTDGEEDQYFAGPEPIYSSGASIDASGNYDVGTWALGAPFASVSNGTITYEVIAVNAAGSVLDSATTTTGALDVSSEAGNTVYLLVRASNTGGYDIGDKATRTSSYGSSNDGYYELASATASGVVPDDDLGTGTSKTNSTTVTMTTTLAVTSGQVVVVILASDDDGGDGSTSLHSAVDIDGNALTKVLEQSNSDGATVSVWYWVATTNVNSGVVTGATLSTGKDAKAITGFVFSIPSGYTVSTDGTAVESVDAGDPGSISVTGSETGDFIAVRGIALEEDIANLGTMTPTSGWSLIAGDGTTGGGAATNQSVHAECKIGSGAATGASNPTAGANSDNASVLVKFAVTEVVASAASGNLTLLGVG